MNSPEETLNAPRPKRINPAIFPLLPLPFIALFTASRDKRVTFVGLACFLALLAVVAHRGKLSIVVRVALIAGAVGASAAAWLNGNIRLATNCPGFSKTLHPMKTTRILCLFFAVVTAALAADPTGSWQWTTHSPNGDIATTLKLEVKDGKLAGAYSNQFGATAITNASLNDDAIAFDVVRDFGGTKYVVKYQGKVAGDTVRGTIEAPGHDGGAPVKLDWSAKRTPAEKKN